MIKTKISVKVLLVVLGVLGVAWVAVNYYQNSSRPSEEFIRGQYLKVLKTRAATKAGWAGLVRLFPGAPGPDLSELKESIDQMRFNNFSIVDSQKSTVNGVTKYKAHIIAGVKIGNTDKNMNEWITFERTDKGWVLSP